MAVRLSLIYFPSNPMPKYLSDLLEAGPIDFVYLDHSPYQSFTKKDGGAYQAGELTLKTRATGAISKEKIFNEAFYNGFVKKLTPGCLVRASKDGKYVKWELVPSGEASQAAPVRSNQAQVKSEREYTATNDAQEEKSIAISLQGFMQQILPRLISTNPEGITDNEAISRSLALAVSAREDCLKKAKEIHTGKLEDKIFGEDITAQF